MTALVPGVSLFTPKRESGFTQFHRSTTINSVKLPKNRNKRCYFLGHCCLVITKSIKVLKNLVTSPCRDAKRATTETR